MAAGLGSLLPGTRSPPPPPPPLCSLSGASFSLERFLPPAVSPTATTGSSHPVAVEKYWSQRYRLFSRFDEGVTLDHGTVL